jgi:hypothetical protein
MKAMHLEILVEDLSGKLALEQLVPRILGPHGEPHTWRILSYRGVGRIPKKLSPSQDPSRRMLLDNLPRLLRGYGSSLASMDAAVVVVIDTDNKDCGKFLRQLKDQAAKHAPSLATVFRLAIEEMEAWYLGDRAAILKAYPRAKKKELDKYEQDSVCGTWELLADAIDPRGARALLKEGYPLIGQEKCEWARRIASQMDPEANKSPSFAKLRDGLRRVISSVS